MGNALTKLLQKAAQMTRPSDVGKLLARVRDEMLRSLKKLLNIDDPSIVEYLTPLIELARRQERLAIATLNYDRSIENAADLAGEECDTGIETWLARGEFGWSDARLRLLKLHGSIDWVVERGVNDRNKLPVTRIRKVAAAEATARSERPAVVFGEAGKLRSEGPYLELLLGFAAELNKADNLLIVGYSFRDKHVNEVIGRWFNADQHRRIVWVDPVDLETVEYRSFAWALTNVDRVFPGDQRRETSPEPPRFQHVQGPTAKALPAGVEAAAVGLFHAGHRGRAAS